MRNSSPACARDAKSHFVVTLSYIEFIMDRGGSGWFPGSQGQNGFENLTNLSKNFFVC